MNLLALETSTEACSVALMRSDGEVFSEFQITPRQHTHYLPLMMNSVLHMAALEKSSIQAIAYANGPGAFTGVRIAAATAQGLAIGLSVPLIPVSTLAVLAQQACDEFSQQGNIQVALDARMGEAYTAVYAVNPSTLLVELKGEEQLIRLEHMQVVPGMFAIGSGYRAHRDAGFAAFPQAVIKEAVHPTATALVKLARKNANEHHVLSAHEASINYIRNRVAEKSK